MIDWRELYHRSQAIKPDESDVSTERVCRLVNMYKNDMIEQDLSRYDQRLLTFNRCCQTCTLKSYTTYKWTDTRISARKNLFDLRLSGRPVSAMTYCWHKTLLVSPDDCGQLSDYKQHDHDLSSVSSMSSINDRIVIRKPFLMSLVPDFVCRWIRRLQMYYIYHRAQRLSSSTEVHVQTMKSFQLLFQSNSSPVFVCFANRNCSVTQLFWTFRHLITLFNWPWNTKIFSNRPFPTTSSFERAMATRLGFVDLSALNFDGTSILCYLYRCLKTCRTNGPIIFLFDESTAHQPAAHDYHLMSFLVDLMRFDLSIPDLVVVPTSMHQSYLSFSQPFLFRELVEYLIEKMNIHGSCFEAVRTVGHHTDCRMMMERIFMHLAFDIQQLVQDTIDVSHLVAAIELNPMFDHSTTRRESVFGTLQTILKACPCFVADNPRLHEVTEEQLMSISSSSKSELVAAIRRNYFLEIIAALSIRSTTRHVDDSSRIFESDLFDRITFLLLIFAHKTHFPVRSCQSTDQIVQRIVQLCQTRSYILMDFIPRRPTAFHDTILSDHDWSDDDDHADFIDEDVDDDDEIPINDLSTNFTKPFYRINERKNDFQLNFFTQLLGSYMDAMVHILDCHIEEKCETFMSEGAFTGEVSSMVFDDILLFVRRAYAYRSLPPSGSLDTLPMFFEPTDDCIYPLRMENLLSLRHEFAHLLTCSM